MAREFDELMPHRTRSAVKTAVPQSNGGAWSVPDLLEPLLLLLVGAMLFQIDRFPPQQLLFGLSLLTIPYLLRWIFYGAPSVGTLVALPMAILFFVLLPATFWITPYFWTLTWPEAVRMVWGGAVFFGVLNWALPHSGQIIAHAQQVRNGALAPRLALLTIAFLGLGGGLALLGLLNMAVANKIPLIQRLAPLLLQNDLQPLGVNDTFNPNRVAVPLVLVAPLPLAWLLAWHVPSAALRRRWHHPTGHFLQGVVHLTSQIVSKIGWLVLWFFFVGGLLLTQSRTALIATAVAMLLILLLTAGEPDGGLRLFGGFLGLCLLVGMGYFVLNIEFAAWLPLFTDLADGNGTSASLAVLADTRSLSGRMVIWERALHGIADHPLTGYGLGTFAEIAQHAYPLPGFVPGELNHAHNLFLQTALDFGVPGLITFATIVVLAGLALVRGYRRAPRQSPQATWSLGLLGSYTAFLLYNLFDGLTLGARPAVIMWFFLGLAIAAGQEQLMGAREDTESGSTGADSMEIRDRFAATRTSEQHVAYESH